MRWAVSCSHRPYSSGRNDRGCCASRVELAVTTASASPSLMAVIVMVCVELMCLLKNETARLQKRATTRRTPHRILNDLYRSIGCEYIARRRPREDVEPLGR